jgi:type I restriction enzyme S subunit
MKFPAYPRYRDSGVEWLGNVPEHWSVVSTKRLFKEVIEKNVADEELLSVTQDQGVVYRRNLEIKVWNPEGETSAYKLIRTGDFVISLRSFQGGIEYSNIRGLVSPAYVVMKPIKEFQHNYMRWFLKCDRVITALNLVTTGIRQGKNISYEDFALLFAPIPPADEQSAIANFLDRETTKIGVLISKQERLIALLQEKRQALISHAVTKGLNPNVPMKNSGTAWLGEIPAHWEAKRLKYLTSQVTVGIVVTPSKYYVESGVPCLRSLNVREGEITDRNLVYISQESNVELSKSMIFTGDLVSVRTGQPGTTAVVDGRFNEANCIDLIVIRKSRQFISKYMEYFLNSSLAKRQYDSGSGGAIQQHFNIETAKNLFALSVPLSEQASIVRHLDHATSVIDDLISKAQQAIQLLAEHRTALISAAVTGKINVRQYRNGNLSNH